MGRFQQGVAMGNDALIFYPNGTIYEGRVVDSTLNGYGKLSYPNNTMTYEGNFSHGIPHG